MFAVKGEKPSTCVPLECALGIFYFLLPLSIILRSSKSNKSPTRTLVEHDRKHCIPCISMPTILKESEHLPLHDTKRFAFYHA